MVSAPVEEPLLRWIPLLPFLAAVLHGSMIGVLQRSASRGLVVVISCGAVFGSFVVTCMALADLIRLEGDGGLLLDTAYTWIGAGIGDTAFSADFAFQFDALSAAMCMVVTGIGFVIHVYSAAYMREDERDDGGYQRFFAYLNLFVAAMLVLVLADNLVLLFLGWEGVGLCSYLLIGFWYSDAANAHAGSKAFIVNRIGDFGFLIGIFLTFWTLSAAGTPTVAFRGIESAAAALVEATYALPVWLGGSEMRAVDVIGLCFFFGAVGKSAQLPLYVWLPDAMAGPTPVSALIHAATMVTAGIYLVCRLSFLYAEAPLASAVIAWTGGATALFAATIAMAQSDIKKILAYSTVSQLGYMFIAVGCGAYTVAIFHLVTHAFFKALLFLCAGAVIQAMRHEQDIWKMGGLRKKLPRLSWLTLIGVWAIAGIPGFSGFFSKDEILLAAHGAQIPGQNALYWIALGTAVMTSFYMFRLYFVTFAGPTRVEPALRSRLNDPGNAVLVPLYTLAVLSIFGGFIGLPQFWGDVIGLEGSDSLANFLGSVVHVAESHEVEAAEEWLLVGRAVLAAVIGFMGAWWIYRRNPELPEQLVTSFPSFHRVLRNKYWIDEFYDRVLVRPLVFISDRVLFRGIDVGAIDGLLVNGTARAVRSLAARGLKHLHSGLVQSYFVFVVAGVVGILLYLVTW